MYLRNKQLVIGVLILFAFVGIGVFGLMQSSHVNHSGYSPMTNCPYAEGGFSICENTLAHINKWRQFSMAVFPSLLILSLLSGLFLYFLQTKSFFELKPSFFDNWKQYLDNKKLYNHPDEIKKWLSLFENSPSPLF